VIDFNHIQAFRCVSELYARLGFEVTRNDGILPPESLVGDRGPFEPRLAVRAGDVTLRVVEVETEQSLEVDAVSRWREAAGWNVPVFVVVPQSLFGRAMELLRRNALYSVVVQTLEDLKAAEILGFPVRVAAS
jgi:hypothetical protein